MPDFSLVSALVWVDGRLEKGVVGGGGWTYLCEYSGKGGTSGWVANLRRWGLNCWA